MKAKLVVGPDLWRRLGSAFDLADFLTWRATGSTSRSACTLTCKWTYLGHERRWDADYFQSIGLAELCANDFDRIGTTIVDAPRDLAGMDIVFTILANDADCDGFEVDGGCPTFLITPCFSL